MGVVVRASVSTRSQESARFSVETPLSSLTLAEIYEAEFEFVWCSLRRLGVQGTLEDAVHDVFVVVARRLHEFEGRSSLRTWLFGIALRVAKSHRRARSRAAHSVSDEESWVGTDADPLRAAVESEAAMLVQRVLDELSDERREILVLAEFGELTAPEIAELLEINVNSVYSRLRLARRDFEQGVRRLRARDAWRQA